MVKLIALMDHIYANKRVKKGSEYEASQADAKILTIMNRAQFAEQSEASQERPKKRYKRRDLRAES